MAEPKLAGSLAPRRKVAVPVKILRRFELWAVLAISLLVFVPAIFRVPFHGDENLYIVQSGKLKLFIERRFTDPAWNEGFWTLSVTPISPYFIAIGRLMGGYGDDKLNGSWSSSQDEGQTVAPDNMPDIGLLRWSRLPMALLAALTAVTLFVLVKRSAGAVAAYLFAALFLLNPYMPFTLVRAMSEASLLAFVAVAAFAGERVLHSGQSLNQGDTAPRRYLAWTLVLGMASGLAGASKANGLAIVAPAAVVALVGPLLHRRGQVVRRNLMMALLGTGIVIASACLTFVLVNPFLYPDPVGRTWKMFVYRVELMNVQLAEVPETRMPAEAGARLQRLAQRVFDTYAVLPQARIPGMTRVLAVVGLGVTLGWVWQWWRSLWRGANERNGIVVLGLIGLSLVGPALLTPLDWDRYYLFPVVFSTWLIAIGLAFLAQRLAALMRR